MRCMVYMDTNMVRAGVVKHPKEWIYCGYNEIQDPRERYGLIDFPKLLVLLQMKNLEELRVSSREWIRDAIDSRNLGRETKWTEGIAVGSRGFVEATKKNLGIRAINRKVTGKDGIYELREPAIPYRPHFDTKNAVPRHENTYS